MAYARPWRVRFTLRRDQADHIGFGDLVQIFFAPDRFGMVFQQATVARPAALVVRHKWQIPFVDEYRTKLTAPARPTGLLNWQGWIGWVMAWIGSHGLAKPILIMPLSGFFIAIKSVFCTNPFSRHAHYAQPAFVDDFSPCIARWHGVAAQRLRWWWQC
jgi:hypothetical protein